MLLLLAAMVVAAAQPASTTRWRAVASRERLLERAADSLLARYVAAAGGGWAWRSSIQAPHYFTDRDVGAAGIAMGLLAAYHTTHRRRYLEGARHAGDWLLAVAERTRGGGLRWPDWHDRKGVSDTHFTSFDDGAAGVSDLLWQLGPATASTCRRRLVQATGCSPTPAKSPAETAGRRTSGDRSSTPASTTERPASAGSCMISLS